MGELDTSNNNLLQKLISEFKNPKAEYRPQYFWFLNHQLDIDEMKRQLNLMKKAGAGGEFLHARDGRITPYMGDEWLRICGEIAKYGAEQDLKIWLYDEDGFPSGFAGGKTLEPDPKNFAANFIVLNEEYEVEPGKSLEISIKFEYSTSELFGIVAFPVNETITGYEIVDFPKSVIDISQQYLEGKVKWTAPNTYELWLVCPFIREWNPKAANVLNKEAMKNFIRKTHQKYYDYFQTMKIENLFGTTVPGIFTDEPGVQYCFGDKSWRRIIAYTPEMNKFYSEKYQIPLIIGLGSVFYDLESHSPDFRLNYWDMAISLYSEAFFKQIKDWCNDHNIWATGHLANDSCLFNQVRDQIDWFRCVQNMHIGPSDQLGFIFRTKFEKSYGLAETDNMMTPRFASSASRIYGFPRTISECFGSSGWNLSLEQQKNLVDWQIANGINLFTPHDFSYSIEGSRKRDHPPAFERCSYFEEINILNDYIGRLCYIFSQKESNLFPRIGILYGNLTILANMNPMKENSASLAHDAQAYLIDLLQRLHFDFDIIPENFIIENKIEHGLISDTQNLYDLIILPALETIREDTLEQLIRFYKDGGKILFLQTIPARFYKAKTNNENENSSEYFFKILGITSQDIESSLKKHTLIPNTDKLRTITNENGGIIGLLQAPDLPIYKNHLMDLVEKFCLNVKLRSIGISKYFSNEEKNEEDDEENKKCSEIGDIVVRRLNLQLNDNSAIIFIANVSQNSYPNCQISILNRLPSQRSNNKNNQMQPIWRNPMLYFMDPTDSSIKAIEPRMYKTSNEIIELNLDISPSVSLVLLISESSFIDLKIGAEKMMIDDSLDKEESSEIIEDWSVSPTKFNILNLDYWNVFQSVTKMGIERPSYLSYHLNHKIKLKCISKPSHLYLIFDGNITHLPRKPNGQVIFSSNQLVLLVNGKKIEKMYSGKILDHHMMETDNIASFFVDGTNIIEILTIGGLSSPIITLTEPVRIFGDFTAHKDPSSNNWTLTAWEIPFKTKITDLRENGFPNYIFPIDFKSTFQLGNMESKNIEYFIKFPKKLSPLYKIWINGEYITHIWYGDYMLKLKNLTSGKHSLHIRYYPYPTNLYESDGFQLGLSQNVQIIKRLSKNAKKSL